MKIDRFNILTEYALEIVLHNHNLERGLFLETLFFGKDGIAEIIPLPHSTTIVFDPTVISGKDILTSIEKAEIVLDEIIKEPVKHVFPICFDNEFALDKKEIINKTGFEWEHIKQMHLNTEYRVEMYGFMPGFFYLTNLDKRLKLERKESPSVKIPRGSVGIAHKYCGIYPTDSPGGWYILGRSKPIGMHNLSAHTNIPNVGDLIQFQEVDKSEL
jgi:KipI family sensor histidine kinase inhibitor